MKKIVKSLSLLMLVTATSCTNTSAPTRATMKYLYKDYSLNSIEDSAVCPSLKKANFLVVPVWFNDSDDYITNKDQVYEDIANSYRGNPEDIGWESVSSYYKKDSYGKLTINATVTDWYNCGYNSTAYYPEDAGSKNTYYMVDAIFKWVRRTLGDTVQFDANKDGYIDSIAIIYAAPDYRHLSGDDISNMWAYTTTFVGYKPNVDAPVPSKYFWASYDFMYSNGDYALSRTGKSSAGTGDTTNCTVDTHTFIHETGHLFGLMDYYDYAGSTAPALSFSMQDMNVGGHDPFSKIALGWSKPYVPKKTTTIKLKPFEENGDVSLLSPKFTNSPFDEYILIEFYTPKGLNEFDTTNRYIGRQKGPDAYGARVWHVDARLYDFNKKVVTTNASEGFLYQATSNTSSGSRAIGLAGKVEYNQNQVISRKTITDWHHFLRDNDLFTEGDEFLFENYQNQFVESGTLNSGLKLGWSFTIDSLSENQMTVTCTKL